MDSLSKHAQDNEARSGPESNNLTLSSGSTAHDILEALDLDPALNRKMHLVNDVRCFHYLTFARFFRSIRTLSSNMKD